MATGRIPWRRPHDPENQCDDMWRNRRPATAASGSLAQKRKDGHSTAAALKRALARWQEDLWHVSNHISFQLGITLILIDVRSLESALTPSLTCAFDLVFVVLAGHPSRTCPCLKMLEQKLLLLLRHAARCPALCVLSSRSTLVLVLVLMLLPLPSLLFPFSPCSRLFELCSVSVISTSYFALPCTPPLIFAVIRLLC